jgi:hypothetical protein
MPKELMSQDFVDTMAQNMWQFMNPDTIEYVLKLAKCDVGKSRKKRVEDDNFTNEIYHNTICFKGSRKEGHYVYVDPHGEVTGTYENKLIYQADDGICHGAALAAAFHNCHPDKYMELIKNPESKYIRYNYGVIMNVYKTIIEKGWWDKALRKYFENDEKNIKWKGKTTEQTQTALETIDEFLDAL